MNNYRIISDVHKYGPHELKNFKFNYEPKNCEIVIFLEDNHDLKNCKKDELQKAILDYKFHVSKCKFFGCLRLRGNHEMMDDAPEYLIVNNVLVTHGYALQLKWLLKKLTYFTNDPKGAGFLRRKAVLAKSKMREMKEVKFSLDELNFMFDYVMECQDKEDNQAILENRKPNKIDTCTFGHTHPIKIKDFMHKGIRFVNVCRGETLIKM